MDSPEADLAVEVVAVGGATLTSVIVVDAGHLTIGLHSERGRDRRQRGGAASRDLTERSGDQKDETKTAGLSAMNAKLNDSDETPHQIDLNRGITTMDHLVHLHHLNKPQRFQQKDLRILI